MTIRWRTAPALLLAGAALLPLGGCMNERVVASDPMPAYTLNEVAYAASNRDLRVVLHGNPFGMDAQSFADKVLPSMQGRVFGVKTNLTTTPNDTARPGYKVVLAFNVAGNMTNSSLCTDGPVPTRPPGGPIVVQGAFCRGGALTSATGWLDNPKGPDDPDFRDLISDMTFSLFPTTRADSSCGGTPDC